MDEVRKYVGHDMAEILDRIRFDLGKDALILKSNVKKSPFKAHQEFEVYASTDPLAKGQASSNKVLLKEPKKKNDLESSRMSLNHVKKYRSPYREEKYSRQETVKEEDERDLTLNHRQEGLDDLRLEVSEMRAFLERYFSDSFFKENKSIRAIRSHLLNNGARHEDVDRFLPLLKKILDRSGESSPSIKKCLKYAKLLIEKLISKIQSPFKLTNHRIFSFVGPTGTGKTTTLAKLASICQIKHKKPVVLVSLDDYRMGAREQLKAYADILNVPFYAFDKSEDLLNLIKSYSKETHFFIDTSGLSPNNKEGIEKIGMMLSPIPDIYTYLTVPAILNWKEKEAILKHFNCVDYNSFILTKFDELSSFGHLLELAFHKVPSLTFITNGQKVPEDIMNFNTSFLSNKILQVK